MKEKIYTIPINEAVESDSECPFCLIEKKLEKESIEYTLGAATKRDFAKPTHHYFLPSRTN